MEELILPYYLKVFSILFISIIIIFVTLFIYSLNKKIILSKEFFSIDKNDKIEKVLKNNIKNLSKIDIFFCKTYYRLNYILTNKYFHYGQFKLEKNATVFDLLKVITKPSNILNKITIVEGWSKLQLNNELEKHFSEFKEIPYESIIADTYFFNNNIKFDTFLQNLKNFKKSYFLKHLNNEKIILFSYEQLMIIGSLIEKEGLDKLDKKKIASVIFNRLEKKMKLQIDATVLYSITEGQYDLKRKLLLKDLKVDHKYNTYKIKGLPPKPISYVGKQTLDVIFENYKSDFLFYFFNKSLKRHIFSETYDEHILRLNEYRK